MAEPQIYVTIPGQGTYPPLPNPGTADRGALKGEAIDAFPEYAPAPKASKEAVDAFPAYSPEPPKLPSREVGIGEAAGRGIASGLTFGAAPALSGLAEASGMPAAQPPPGADPNNWFDPNPVRPVVGAAKLLHNYFSDHPDEAVKAAYEKGRQSALAEQQLAQEQHPAAFLAGQLGGAVAMPIPGFGAMKAATTGARVARGALAGGVGGGAFGAGTAVGEGKSAPEVAEEGVKGALIGAPLGGTLSGALGRGGINPNTAGQRATRTAEDLGAPLPRGLASDSPFVQATTQQAAQIPMVGGRIGRRAEQTVNAAGNRINEIASGLAPTTDRAAADAVARPGLESVIGANRQAIDAGYGRVRGMIDENARFSLPRTQAALAQIERARAAAGHVNPGQGLEQFENLVNNGATFNGLHRARVDAREAGNAVVPHPGYNAGDFNRLARAMATDLRQMVGMAAINRTNAPQAHRAFEAAERQFENLSEQNKLLHRLVNARGEGTISSLLGAAKEKGGNLELLRQLRAGMPQQDFEQIAGTLLHEIGQSPRSGEFSLNKFSTEWAKLSDGAKDALFQPAHRRMIDDIADLGRHLKGGDQFRNTSNTASAIILWDVVRAAGETGVAWAAGLVNPMAVAGVAGAAITAELLTRALASPARAAAMSAWSRAYRGALQNRPTPARTAALVIATRNLGHNLGVPANDIGQIIQRYSPVTLPVAAGDNEPKAKNQ